MGCGTSATAVYPLMEVKLNGNQDETENKSSSRVESAVSKVTTDSGVVMENRDILVLPALIPNQIPTLTSDRDEKTAAPSLLRENDAVQERAKSSEILAELLSQGIIPMRDTRESGGGATYSIMLGKDEGVTRRPPARLEALKARKAQSLYSREEMDERMKLVEERRKLMEDKRKARLRTKSAHVRKLAPISPIRKDDGTFLSPVESLLPPLTHHDDPTSTSLLRSQIPREAADGGEWVREAAADGREEKKSDESKGGLEEEDEINRGTSDIKEEEEETHVEEKDKEETHVEEKDKEETHVEEEEETHVEELNAEGLLTASGLESDSSFQHAEEGEEVF